MQFLSYKERNFLAKLNFIILNLLYVHCEDVAATEFCPAYCRCDLYLGLNRADCSFQRLISPNVELPSVVEILDLSHNEISILDNKSFQEFAYLQYFNLSHNSIHTIYPDAFSSLHSVTHIDLSYNRLEYVDEYIFETNSKLNSLHLAANKFMFLQNKPLLRSNSLRSLNLRKSQINHLYTELFTALPNLYDLDVSQNLMITLNVEAFGSPSQHLGFVNLSANRWHCDRGLQRSVEILRERDIQAELSDCEEAKKNTKFERMQMLETINNDDDGGEVLEQKDMTINTSGNNISHIWRHPTLHGKLEDIGVENADGDNDSIESWAEPKRLRLLYATEAQECESSWHRLCRKYLSCRRHIRALILHQEKDEIALQSMGYTLSDLNFVFLMGISLGVTFVVCIVSCALCVKRCCESRIKYGGDIGETYRETTSSRPSHTMTTNSRATELTTLSTSPLMAPTVAPYRHHRNPLQRRSPQPTTNRAVVRREYAMRPRRDSFLSRFLGRPARHQYYRSFSQNSATLIRRLSRSNLFSNRLSQHAAEESRSRTDSRLQGNEIPDEEEDEMQSFQELTVLRNGRSETPPPSYREVVVNEIK